MRITRGQAGTIPYAATGAGAPVVVAAGLWPTTGVDSDRLVHGALVPLRRVAGPRRLIVFNRRANLPPRLTMRDLATEYADAIGAEFGTPIDIMGNSTGGSLAQQLAADHPGTVRRLVLVSTACRLGPVGRQLQRQVAGHLRAGRTRAAVSLLAASLAPAGLRTVTGGLAWTAARHVVADSATAGDLAATLEAEDGFDLAMCNQPIAAKTLIVVGGRDRFYNPELFTATAALIPDSHLRLFPRRGHISVASDPRAQATIAQFLCQA